jgi:FK506-binding nuclear protein
MGVAFLLAVCPSLLPSTLLLPYVHESIACENVADFAQFRITMAAIDPSAEPQIDEDHKVPRATLRIIRVPMDLDDEDDEEEDDEDFDGEDVESIVAKLRAGGVALPEEDEDSEEDSDDESNGGPSDKAKSKKAKEAALKKKIAQEIADDEMEIDAVNGKGKGKVSAEEDSDEESLDDDEDDEEAEEIEEFVLCTLDPERVRFSASPR